MDELLPVLILYSKPHGVTRRFYVHVLTLIQYEMVAILSKSSSQTQRVATPRGAGRVVTR